MEFQVRYLALFLLFSVIDSCWQFWMGSLHKNIQLMLDFLKVPFLALHFSYDTLMTFLVMLSIILLSMLMILLSTPSVISHVMCDNNQNQLLNLNLICETGAGSGLLASEVTLYLYGHAWNTVAMSGLVLLVATQNCQISYKTDMQDCCKYSNPKT